MSFELVRVLKDRSDAQPYPGPWKVVYCDDGTVWVQDSSAEGLVVCDIPGDMETIEGRELANADLIAAAPELLAALKAVVQRYGPSVTFLPETGAWGMALAAINKAEAPHA